MGFRDRYRPGDSLQTPYFEAEVDNGNSGLSKNIDWNSSNRQKITLTNNCTLDFTAPVGVTNLLLKVIQDDTGSRTVTWPSSVIWPSATAPTLTTTAGIVDFIALYYDGTNYFGQYSLNFNIS